MAGPPGVLFSLVVLTVTNLPAVQETGVQSVGQKDSLEKGMATYARILAWGIPWTEEPQTMCATDHGVRESDMTE